jgi:hypothetical protein
MRRLNSLLLLWTLPGWVWAADKDATETALIILLLLGLAAIIGGLGSIRDMRRKHMLPPRPRPRPPADKPHDKSSERHSH